MLFISIITALTWKPIIESSGLFGSQFSVISCRNLVYQFSVDQVMKPMTRKQGNVYLKTDLLAMRRIALQVENRDLRTGF